MLSSFVVIACVDFTMWSLNMHISINDVLVPHAVTSNIAMKILNPKLDRLSYRFSKAIHLDFYRSTNYFHYHKKTKLCHTALSTVKYLCFNLSHSPDNKS